MRRSSLSAYHAFRSRLGGFRAGWMLVAAVGALLATGCAVERDEPAWSSPVTSCTACPPQTVCEPTDDPAVVLCIADRPDGSVSVDGGRAPDVAGGTPPEGGRGSNDHGDAFAARGSHADGRGGSSGGTGRDAAP